MTRRHFDFIAHVIRDLPVDDKGFVAEAFAIALRQTNPRFDKVRFLKACDVS